MQNVPNSSDVDELTGSAATDGPMSSNPMASREANGLDITAVNDAPAATITPATYAATEQTTLNLKNNGLSVSDVDGGSGSETVTLSVTEGTLNLTAGTSGATVSNSGTSSVTITGTIAQIDALLDTDGTSTVSYIDNTDTPGASTTLTLAIHDNGNTGGGDLPASDTATINITAVNDAPVISLQGNLDIVAAIWGNSTVDVLLADGLGGFSERTAGIGGGVRPNSVAIGDLNGDGKPDIVTANSGSNVSILLGDGLGGFSASTAGLGGGGASASVALGDLNGDGKLDIVTANGGTDNVSVLLGNGLGGFSASTIRTGGFGSDPFSVALGDVDGDGKLDIVTANAGSDTIAVLLGNGAGGFTASTTGIGGGSTPISVALGDVNGDGKLDIVTANQNSDNVSVLLGDGHGGFSASTIGIGGGSSPFAVALGDVNGDGTLDIVTANHGSNNVSVLLGDGHGGFSASTIGIGGGFEPWAVALGDLNGDGKLDIVTANNGSILGRPEAVSVLLGNGSGGFSASTTGSQGDFPVGVALGDVNTAQVTDEDSALVLSAATHNAITLSDADAGSGNETLALSVSHGTLTLATESNLLVSGDGTDSVSLTGTVTDINAALDGLSYLGDHDYNGSDSLVLHADDGGNTGSGGAQTADKIVPIVVDAVNDAPSAVITTDQYSATENVALDIKNTGMSVSDTDALGAVETVTLSVTEGTLSIDAGGSGATVNNSGTSSVTINGTIAQINALLNTDGTSVVDYVDNTDNPSASATLRLSIDDGGNTGSGGALTGSDTSTINITAQNDAPVATITPTSYSGQRGVLIDLKNNGLSVSDVDGNSGSETVTLSVTSGTLSVTAGTSGAAVLDSGTSSVTMTGTITQINALLDTDATSTVSFIDPAGGVKTLTLAIHDNGNTGGGDLSAQDTAQLVLDQPPVVDLNGAAAGTGVTLAYTENDPATAIAPAGVTTDADSTDYNGGSLAVHLTAGDTQDELSILTDATVTVSAGTVSVSGHAVGTVTGGTNGTDLVVSFNTADAAPAAISTLIEHITYTDSSDNPAASRSVTFTVDDGDGSSGSAVATVNITSVNDAPLATITPASYAATEQTALNLKNNGLSVGDVDGGSGSETVTLSVGEGTLNVTAGTSGAGVSGSGTNSVTITGTIAQIDDLLNTDGTSTVNYIDNTDTPSASTTLSLTIHDNGNTGGGDLSSNASATMNITAVNDAPVAIITPVSFAATEQTTLDLKNNGLSVSDVDSLGASETVTLSVTEGTLTLGVGTSGVTIDSGNGTNSVTFHGTIAQLNDLLNTNGTSSVSYIDNTDNPSASATLTLAINDNGHTGTGGPLVGTATSTVDVTAVNDAPVALIATNPYDSTPNVALDLKNTGMLVSDVDGNNGIETVTLSVSEGTLTLGAGSSGAVIDGGNGTGSVTFHGTIAQLDALLNTDGTSAVSYIDTNANPSDNVQLSLSINDGGHTGTGGPLSSTAVSVITDIFAEKAPGAFDFNFDSNGNGHADILLQNGSSGAVAIWEERAALGRVHDRYLDASQLASCRRRRLRRQRQGRHSLAERQRFGRDLGQRRRPGTPSRRECRATGISSAPAISTATARATFSGRTTTASVAIWDSNAPDSDTPSPVRDRCCRPTSMSSPPATSMATGRPTFSGRTPPMARSRSGVTGTPRARP